MSATLSESVVPPSCDLMTSPALINSSMLMRMKNTNAGESLPLKKRRPVPVQNKDETYYEKRRKNNESAKRSRDMKRSKEEQMCYHIQILTQENLQLKTELEVMRRDSDKLKAMLYASSTVSGSS